jgi:2,4-diaminopentanoate dehydrogenase
MPIRVLHIGLGPIGAAVVRQVATRPGFKAVGAIDIDAAKKGRDLGEVVGLQRRLRVTVSDDLGAVVKATRPDVAVLCTSSSLKKVWPQMEAVLKLKLPIVSTTEELAYPWWNQKALSKTIDAAARKARVAVVGTGVNPGFTMDALPITLTGVCQDVTAITVSRVQDARSRRLPFQQKIGCGLTRAEFQARVEAGTVRHVGLTESIAMIAGAMGWKLERVTDQIKPVVSQHGISSPLLTVAPGRVCGLIQDGVGYVGGKAIITLHMEAYLGAPESYDSVNIDGTPALAMKIAGGVHGDVATASITVNSIPKVIAAAPGLHTMRTLPIPSWFGGRVR